METSFGGQLRTWRRTRGLSQLGLASEAQVSARHVAFLEKGRAQPSPGMVIRLAKTLAVPLREQNQLLLAAGHAPRYPERALSSTELEPFSKVIDQMLVRHDPLPGIAIDRAWRIIRFNRGAARVMPSLARGTCGLQALVDSPLFELMTNAAEVAGVLLDRVREETVGLESAPDLAELRQRAEAVLRPIAGPGASGVRAEGTEERGTSVLCPRFDIGGTLVETVSVLTRFTTARDLTLDELRVELTFPANEAAEAFLSVTT